jgi:antitoxin (DNA-binding transcriptional repressor) of toxin-antitoxin stability system
MEPLHIQTLRESTSTYVALAESGRAFVVLRHSDPLAVLRPLCPEDIAEDVPISRFRTDLRTWLDRAGQRPLRLTWHGRLVAIVEGVDAREGDT